MALLEHLSLLKPSTITLLATAAAVTLALVLRFAGASSEPNVLRRAVPSPRETLLPHITSTQASALAYPPNLLPGARDVDTPYGTMRVYEWGPADGKRVLLIPGDTTPGPMLAPIAEALVSRGCRVMIFDLWGRGYSDSPLNVPHDARLFGNQIFFAAASSSLPWINSASGGFSIIGFSLGGGITMSFAAYFPCLVSSIVLLAPGGILRYLPQEYETPFFRYPRLVPLSYLRKLVGHILGVKISEAPREYTALSNLKDKANLDVPAIVQWQFDHHKGFVYSFINTIAHGPLMHQHSDWRAVCNIIKGNSSAIAPSSRSSKLFNSKILVILGESDGVVAENHLSPDLSEMIGGSDHVEFKVVPGGHGFPVPSSNDVVKHICEFWNLPINCA